MSPSAVQQLSITPVDEEKSKQLSYLIALLGAINDTCKDITGSEFSSGEGSVNGSGTSGGGGDSRRKLFPVFLNKLAQICDSRKGGDTVTAVVCLKGEAGTPEYVFCSNDRDAAELDETVWFLSGILTYISTNPDNLNEKPLQRQVLWRILEFNFDRVRYYVKALADEVENCIRFGNIQSRIGDDEDPNTIAQLDDLQDKCNFPLDLEVARDKCLSDCETLIKAIVSAKGNKFDTAMETNARQINTRQGVSWCQLRHFVGRLHSYRTAAEKLCDAFNFIPGAFRGFTMRSIPSAAKKRSDLPREMTLESIIGLSFPGDPVGASYGDDIGFLSRHGLDDRLRERLCGPKRVGSKKGFRVHTELLLHSYLVGQGKTKPSDFWLSSKYIATSKPTCRLCHYYFQSEGNSDFQTRATHMNIYQRWRLPDLPENSDSGTVDQDAVEDRDELMDEMIWTLQDDVRGILRNKVPLWKRHDSPTDTYAGPSRMSGLTRGAMSQLSDVRSQGTSSGMNGVRLQSRGGYHSGPKIEPIDEGYHDDFSGLPPHAR